MYNIAVLVYDLVNDYNHAVVEGIYSYFADKPDVRVIVAPVSIPHAGGETYDYQYWFSTLILQAKQIDGIIIIPNSFDNHVPFETIEKELQVYKDKPVVSVSRPINLPKCKYTFNTCKTAYEEVIKHLKEKHGKKRIAFFGAGLVESPESELRFNCFKDALKKNNLEFYPELVFNGDFTPGTAKDLLSQKIKSKADLNFDAICCVNDYTCGGCLLVFDALGIKVPEDVVIFGYDDSDFARKTFPTLSSISQSVPLSGTTAAEMIYKTVKNEQVDDIVYIDSFPVYRQSCGCISTENFSNAYIDHEGNYHAQNDKEKWDEISAIKNHQDTLTQIYHMITLMDNRISMDKVLSALYPSMGLSHFSAMLVSLYKSPILMDKDDDYELPEEGNLQLAINVEKEFSKLFPFGEDFTMNLRERIVPEEYEKYLSGLYILHPVFMRNKNYGYIFCKVSYRLRDYVLYSINLKIISDILANAYEYSQVIKQQEKLIENSVNLSLRSKTDELTQVFNRRGIMEYGQQLIDLSVTMNKTGSVFFCDLDGLKKINDTYGHKIGDLAIKTEAEVLKASFRDADLVGRLSGDEFCAIAPGFPSNRIDILRKKLLENNKKFSEEAGLPFTLSISVGAMGFSSDASDLAALLQQADQQLYEEKHIKHGDKK